jgi:PAS domain S-box-containing protein
MSASQILVVEDEAIVATAIKNELQQFGYRVPAIAASATEAIEKAVKEKPDLVLMDIHLQGEPDGIEAAREIRKRCGIPVVYLSAFADAETVSRAGATEAFGYLLKPYEELELQTTIEVALAKHRAEQKLEKSGQLMAAILEGLDAAVIATDPANQVRFMNIAGEALTGWRRETVAGVSVAAVCNLVAEGNRVLLKDLADSAVVDSCSIQLPPDTRLVNRSGGETPVEGCVTPIHDRLGEFLGAVLTLRNIATRLESQRARRQNEALCGAAPASLSKPRGVRPTILLADADPLVRNLGCLILEEEGYQVLVAEDGVQAVETFRKATQRIDIAIIDLNIPCMTGDAVLERLLELDPNIEVLFSSDYFAEDRPEGQGGSHLLGVICKPYRRRELVNTVHDALARRTEWES